MAAPALKKEDIPRSTKVATILFHNKTFDPRTLKKYVDNPTKAWYPLIIPDLRAFPQMCRRFVEFGKGLAEPLQMCYQNRAKLYAQVIEDHLDEATKERYMNVRYHR